MLWPSPESCWIHSFILPSLNCGNQSASCWPYGGVTVSQSITLSHQLSTALLICGEGIIMSVTLCLDLLKSTFIFKLQLHQHWSPSEACPLDVTCWCRGSWRLQRLDAYWWILGCDVLIKTNPWSPYQINKLSKTFKDYGKALMPNMKVLYLISHSFHSGVVTFEGLYNITRKQD